MQMHLGWIEAKLELMEKQLDQIIAILHQQQKPRYRPSSYSQSLDCRGKEYKVSKKTGQFKYQDDRENKD